MISIKAFYLHILLVSAFAACFHQSTAQPPTRPSYRLQQCSHRARISRTGTVLGIERGRRQARRREDLPKRKKLASQSEQYLSIYHRHHRQRLMGHLHHQHHREYTLASSKVLILMFESNLNSAIITISVGPSQRLFAAHEDVLCKSPHFAQMCRAQFFQTPGKRIDLPNEEPEVFSAVLEYLYKGDYTPKVAYDKKRASWYLEDSDAAAGESTIHQGSVGGAVLKDTIVYVCVC